MTVLINMFDVEPGDLVMFYDDDIRLCLNKWLTAEDCVTIEWIDVLNIETFIYSYNSDNSDNFENCPEIVHVKKQRTS